MGLHRTYIGDLVRGERNVILMTADKLVRGLDFTLASLFVEMEQGPGTTEDE